MVYNIVSQCRIGYCYTRNEQFSRRFSEKPSKIAVLEATPAFRRREIGRAFMDHTVSTDPFLYYCFKGRDVSIGVR